jgi:hypothetical protein
VIHGLANILHGLNAKLLQQALLKDWLESQLTQRHPNLSENNAHLLVGSAA